MPRTETDYDLPPLTFDEAARVLGIEKGQLMQWVMERLAPSPTQWSLWKNGERPLPEAIVRLYLTHRGAIESAYQRDLRELKEQLARAVEEKARKPKEMRRKQRRSA